ncbi:hypothetical protein GOBAR_DD22299 [Gossypium barbadense]|nr:hypothetical protein GOBAR_DD22299 [Gossypium barbadense]
MSNNDQEADNLESVFKKKRIIRSNVRQTLKSMDPSLRSQEDDIIQSIVLEAPWFKSSKRLCAYISCSALREVDTSKLLSQILSPAPVMHANDPVDLFILPDLKTVRPWWRVCALFVLPWFILLLFSGMSHCHRFNSYLIISALIFGTCPRWKRYYDTFLKNYKELAKEKNWRLPLFVALSYSVQIMDEEVIPVTPNDVLVDALVSPTGVIPITSAALGRMKP